MEATQSTGCTSKIRQESILASSLDIDPVSFTAGDNGCMMVHDEAHQEDPKRVEVFQPLAAYHDATCESLIGASRH